MVHGGELAARKGRVRDAVNQYAPMSIYSAIELVNEQRFGV